MACERALAEPCVLTGLSHSPPHGYDVVDVL